MEGCIVRNKGRTSTVDAYQCLDHHNFRRSLDQQAEELNSASMIWPGGGRRNGERKTRWATDVNTSTC